MTRPLSAQASERPRVLVTDAQWNKSVAAIRALGSMGVPVTAGESTRLAAGLFSRHVSRRLIYPSALADPAGFLSALVKELKTGGYGTIMPMEMSTLLLISRHRQDILPYARFPFAPHEVLLRAARKWPVAEAAAALGIPAPRTRFLPGSAQLRELGKDLIADLGLPLVLKADLSEGSRGLSYCYTRQELDAALGEAARSGADYVAQEMIPPGGEALGVSVLMGEGGAVLGLSGHRRLREYPVGGGPSTCRESFIHPEAREHALHLLRGLGYTGLAMVEFKTDPRDGGPKLMEVNPKFWGSLALAIESGVNFPYLLHAWALGLPLPECQQVPGVRVRSILPGELLYLWARKGRVGRDFWHMPGARDDLFSWKDPGPVLGRMLSAVACLYEPNLRAVLKARQAP